MARVSSKKPLHFPITNKQLGELFTVELTAAEWRLYLYLSTLDPFGDTGVKYNAEEAMLFCQLKRSTYFSAKAKFVELGLFEFVDGTTKVRNLKGLKTNPQSEALDLQSKVSDLKSKILDFKSEISDFESEISDSKLSEQLFALQSETLHTISDLNQTLSDCPAQSIYGFEGDEIENLDPEIREEEKLSFDRSEDFKVKEIEFVDLDSELQIQEDETELISNTQKTNTNNPSISTQTHQDPFQVPPSPAAPEISFLDWVKHYKAQNARNPLIYAQTCIKRDEDGSLRAEYEKWLEMRKDPVYSPYKPEKVVLPPPEERPRIVAKAREFLRLRGIKV